MKELEGILALSILTACCGDVGLVQAEGTPPNKTANWLPAPDGNFRLSMRPYVPKPEVLGGKWTPPAAAAMKTTGAPQPR